MIAIQETTSGCTFVIKVQPRARRNAIVGEIAGALKLALIAPPIEGRANEACIAFLAELLDVPHSSVTIIRGHSNRNKVVRISGLLAEEVRKRLQA